MNGPPGIDPALIAACNRRIEATEGKLVVSRMRNRHLHRLLDDARSADHLITRGELRRMAEGARTTALVIAAIVATYVVRAVIDGNYVGVIITALVAAAWTPAAIRYWRRATTIQRNLEETR